MCQPEFVRKSVSSMILVQILLFHHTCTAFFLFSFFPLMLVLHHPLICLGHFHLWLYQHCNYSHMHSGREEWKARYRLGFKVGGVNRRRASTIRGPEPWRFSMQPIVVVVQCHAPRAPSSDELFVPFSCLPSPLSCLSHVNHCDDQDRLQHIMNSDIYIITKTKTITLGSWTQKLNWLFLRWYQARVSIRIYGNFVMDVRDNHSHHTL